jgi:hypothetical protein
MGKNSQLFRGRRYRDVASSNVAGVAYDAKKRRLRVRFLNGTAYEYEGVDADVAAALAKAESAGGYFHAKIRGQFEVRRLKRWQKRKPQAS